jgi:hypothetical protein
MLEEVLLRFANLHEVASLSSDTYKRQDELVDRCRAEGRSFLAMMPLRHMFRCSVCGLQEGEAVMHFERVSSGSHGPVVLARNDPVWPSSSAYFVEVMRSRLHSVVAHGETLPAELQEFFDGVR